ncbi:MAG: type VI secretion system tube protein Hcp [Aestuariivita sp.]|nr:type VI secretion system tube protein Hcp [Aestuariivita sp.]
MAVIAIKIGTVAGESTIGGYEDQVEAIGIRDSVETGLGAPSRGGRGRASDVELIRFKDSASPKLMQACSSAENLGEVLISLFQTVESGTVAFMEYKLEETYISRVEQSTLDEANYGFIPHIVPVTRGLPTPGSVGLSSVLAPVVSQSAANTRMVPTSLGPAGNGYANREIERVYLNFNKITWTYTPYTDGKAGGAVERGFDLRAGVPV